jgi:hypothetical protein
MELPTCSEGEPWLCLTCRYATIVRGVRLRDEIAECSELAYGRSRITFPVTASQNEPRHTRTRGHRSRKTYH